jgi:hypothetical protein
MVDVVQPASAANANAVLASQGWRGGAKVGSSIAGDSRLVPRIAAAAMGRCGPVWHRSGRARIGARRRFPVLAEVARIDVDTIAAGAAAVRSIHC